MGMVSWHVGLCFINNFDRDILRTFLHYFFTTNSDCQGSRTFFCTNLSTADLNLVTRKLHIRINTGVYCASLQFCPFLPWYNVLQGSLAPVLVNTRKELLYVSTICIGPVVVVNNGTAATIVLTSSLALGWNCELAAKDNFLSIPEIVNLDQYRIVCVWPRGNVRGVPIVPLEILIFDRTVSGISKGNCIKMYASSSSIPVVSGSVYIGPAAVKVILKSLYVLPRNNSSCATTTFPSPGATLPTLIEGCRSNFVKESPANAVLDLVVNSGALA